MASKKLLEFLNEHHIKFTNIKHSPAYTAAEIAHSAHVPGDELAKTVIIKVDGKIAMVVTTANDKLSFNALQKSLGTSKIELASERDFQDKFPGCELGAMPPFGNLFGMEVYVDKKLTVDPEIVINSGEHDELLKISFEDFSNLVHPTVVNAVAA